MLKPDFNNLARVLEHKKPDKPTLFEFFMNQPLMDKLADPRAVKDSPNPKWNDVAPIYISGFANAGYDYCTVAGSDFTFPHEAAESKQTLSLNAGHEISDRDSFNRYPWPDADSFDYSRLDRSHLLPDGMKLIVAGPGGLLENVITLVGYETLCMILADDRRLAADLFDAIGSRLYRYYEICAAYDTVGACIVNDDWGFKTQTMLSPADMCEFVFPWHKKTVEIIHQADKYAILHSCGRADDIMEDIIDDMKYDGKHSYEDVIEPVEQAYDKYHKRIAILGGIDLDFVCRQSPDAVRKRSEEMIRRSEKAGGSYALGTGNSVPEYVPEENYFAMIDVVRNARKG